MISNDYTWSPERRKFQQPHQEHYAPPSPRPFVQEDSLKSLEVQIERKKFVLSLKENPRGCFLRITEDTGGRFNSIIVPATGLGEFQKLLGEMLNASNEVPVKPTGGPGGPLNEPQPQAGAGVAAA